MGVTSRSGKYIKFIIYLIAIVLINAAGLTLFSRIDLTKNKVYSISRASRQVVSTLSEPLTINVFFTRNLPAPYNNTERYLHDLLEEYAIHSNRYFNYRFYDVSPEEDDISDAARENQQLATNYGIYPVQIQILEKDELKFKKAYMGLVLIHGDTIETIPTITATDGLEYKLTTAIQKQNNKISALLGLSGKIDIKLFLSSSLKAVAPYMGIENLPDLPDKVRGIVEKLNEKNYGKLNYVYFDPSTDEALNQEAKAFNVMSLKWPGISNGKVPAGEGVIGLVMTYADRVVEMPLLNVIRVPLIGTQYSLADMDSLEENIGSSLESLIDINENIGYLADHGTLQLWGSPAMGGQQQPELLSNFRSMLARTYSIKDIRLAEDTIPEGLKCLVVAQPTKPFSDYELYQLDQMLMRGTSLVVFTDAFNEIMPPQQQFGYRQPPMYAPLQTGLEKLLGHYGVHIKTSYVLDENCYSQKVPAELGGGERAIYFAPVIQNRFINNDLDFMKNIKGLITMKNSPVELDEKRVSEIGAKTWKLFASSEKSWEMTGRINLDPMSIQPPSSDADQKSLPLACLIEGEFPSYFAGRPMPEKSVEEKDPADTDQEIPQTPAPAHAIQMDLTKVEETGGSIEKSKPVKIFLIGTSEILKDNMLDEEGNSPNATFVMNVLDAANNRNDIAVMRSKIQEFNPLDDTGALAKTFVKTFNIAGLPVLVVLFGLFVWLRRLSRRKHIQMMYDKQ